MLFIRPLFAGLTILVGIIGIILSVLSAGTVWRSADTMLVQTADVLDAALTVKNNADEYITQIDVVLSNMESRVNTLKGYAETVAGDAALGSDTAPLVNRLDENLIRELGEARKVLTSIQTGSDRLNEVVTQFDSLSSSMRMFRKTDQESDESDLALLSRSLTEVSELIQQVLNFVDRMQKQGITEDQAEQMVQAVVRLHAVLDRESNRLASLQDTLDRFGTSLEAKRRQIPRWTRMAVIAFTIFSICFIFTQIHLIHFGRSFLAAATQQSLPCSCGRRRDEDGRA